MHRLLRVLFFFVGFLRRRKWTSGIGVDADGLGNGCAFFFFFFLNHKTQIFFNHIFDMFAFNNYIPIKLTSSQALFIELDSDL